jgi:hypothetical protein
MEKEEGFASGSTDQTVKRLEIIDHQIITIGEIHRG